MGLYYESQGNVRESVRCVRRAGGLEALGKRVGFYRETKGITSWNSAKPGNSQQVLDEEAFLSARVMPSPSHFGLVSLIFKYHAIKIEQSIQTSCLLCCLGCLTWLRCSLCYNIIQVPVGTSLRSKM